MDDKLITWFKTLYAERTPPKSIQDVHPDYRVTWHETATKMKELGYGNDAVSNRIAFAKLFAARKLRTYCNRLIRATGSNVLMSAEDECSKATRKAY